MGWIEDGEIFQGETFLQAGYIDRDENWDNTSWNTPLEWISLTSFIQLSFFQLSSKSFFFWIILKLLMYSGTSCSMIGWKELGIRFYMSQTWAEYPKLDDSDLREKKIQIWIRISFPAHGKQEFFLETVIHLNNKLNVVPLYFEWVSLLLDQFIFIVCCIAVELLDVEESEASGWYDIRNGKESTSFVS